VGGQALCVNEFDQGSRDRTKINVPFIWSGDDEQDVHPVSWELIGKRRWVVDTAKTPFNLAVEGQQTRQWVLQSFPWPREDVRVVAAHLKVKLFGAISGCLPVEVASDSSSKKGVKDLLSPTPYGVLDVLGPVGSRSERVVEKDLQVPGKLLEQITVWAALDSTVGR
jgi:hypothetical protein